MFRFQNPGFAGLQLVRADLNLRKAAGSRAHPVFKGQAEPTGKTSGRIHKLFLKTASSIDFFFKDEQRGGRAFLTQWAELPD